MTRNKSITLMDIIEINDTLLAALHLQAEASERKRQLGII